VTALSLVGCAGDAAPTGELSSEDAGTLDAGGAEATLSRPALTPEQCAERGGAPVGVLGRVALGDPMELSRDDDCPGSRAWIGTLEYPTDSDGALCCEVPAGVSPEACIDAGGRIVADPGGGSSYILGCVPGETLIGWLTSTCRVDCHTTGICCR
jgi:hypothetical protein